ncbi:MAG: (deoxy)nucleoside triphosphate pyrophosphohydrolase [Leptospirales bacterium]
MTQPEFPKRIIVACALIEHEGLILAARRKEGGVFSGKWEFPGGKVEAGETPEECVVREVVEELGILVGILSPLTPAFHRYPSLEVTIYPFVSKIVSGEIVRNVHDAIAWVHPQQMESLDWLEADLPILREYRSRLEKLGR